MYRVWCCQQSSNSRFCTCSSVHLMICFCTDFCVCGKLRGPIVWVSAYMMTLVFLYSTNLSLMVVRCRCLLIITPRRLQRIAVSAKAQQVQIYIYIYTSDRSVEQNPSGRASDWRFTTQNVISMEKLIWPEVVSPISRSTSLHIRIVHPRTVAVTLRVGNRIRRLRWRCSTFRRNCVV